MKCFLTLTFVSFPRDVDSQFESLQSRNCLLVYLLIGVRKIIFKDNFSSEVISEYFETFIIIVPRCAFKVSRHCFTIILLLLFAVS